MIQSLYAGASGMEAQQLNLNVIANNLANANTTGFKRSKIEFQDLLYQKPRTAGADAGNGNLLPTGSELGSGTRVVATAKMFTQGQLTQTGNELDLAIDGDGFFKVLRVDGTDAYTRDGTLKLDSTGRLVTSDGLPLVGLPVLSDARSINVMPTGEVSYTDKDGKSIKAGALQMYRFPNPSGLRSLGGNIYGETDSSGTALSGSPGVAGMGQVVQRFLESSNVNIVEEMVGMIQAQRAYEINSKAITTSDEMLSQLSQLKR
ncbi:MAG: flagellar basal-body rod protein FlgG [Verrucomicrobia bacterium]|nr:flagellar basal-body rod protein FlgG [Verrucomicrobiota bacterium]